MRHSGLQAVQLQESLSRVTDVRVANGLFVAVVPFLRHQLLLKNVERILHRPFLEVQSWTVVGVGRCVVHHEVLLLKHLVESCLPILSRPDRVLLVARTASAGRLREALAADGSRPHKASASSVTIPVARLLAHLGLR